MPDRLPGADQHRRPGRPAPRRAVADAGAATLGVGGPALGRRDPLGGLRADRSRRAAGAAGHGLSERPGGWSAPTPSRATTRSCPAAAGRGLDRPAIPLAVYVPACIGTMFGPTPGARGVGRVPRLCERAGVQVRVPEGIAGLCCGTPWKSKGMTAGHTAMRDRVLAALAPEAADQGGPAAGRRRRRVVHRGLPHPARPSAGDGCGCWTPSSSPTRCCCRGCRRRPGCRLTGPAPDLLLGPARPGPGPAAGGRRRRRDGRGPRRLGVLRFAGDRGLLHPELTAAATAPEAAEVRGQRLQPRTPRSTAPASSA